MTNASPAIIKYLAENITKFNNVISRKYNIAIAARDNTSPYRAHPHQ